MGTSRERIEVEITYESEKCRFGEVALLKNDWLATQRSLAGRMAEAPCGKRLAPQPAGLVPDGARRLVDAKTVRGIERAAGNTAIKHIWVSLSN